MSTTAPIELPRQPAGYRARGSEARSAAASGSRHVAKVLEEFYDKDQIKLSMQDNGVDYSAWCSASISCYMGLVKGEGVKDSAWQ